MLPLREITEELNISFIENFLVNACEELGKCLYSIVMNIICGFFLLFYIFVLLYFSLPEGTKICQKTYLCLKQEKQKLPKP